MRYGHFDNEHREYVIERVDLPTSWTNYLGVENLAVYDSIEVHDQKVIP